MTSPSRLPHARTALGLGPLVAAVFLAILLGSELTACALAVAWSVGGMMHLSLLATEIGAGVLMIPVIWATVAAFRHALEVERRLAAERTDVG